MANILCSEKCVSERWMLKLQKILLDFSITENVHTSEIKDLEEKHCSSGKSHILWVKLLHWYSVFVLVCSSTLCCQSKGVEELSLFLFVDCQAYHDLCSQCFGNIKTLGPIPHLLTNTAEQKLV